jgi:hypothetical protein
MKQIDTQMATLRKRKKQFSADRVRQCANDAMQRAQRSHGVAQQAQRALYSPSDAVREIQKSWHSPLC